MSRIRMQLRNNDLQKLEALPAGWQLTTLGQALPIYYGKGLTKASRDESGTYPVFGSSGQVGKHSKALTAKPSLVIGRKGSVGEVHYSKVPCWPIDTVYFAEESEGSELKYFEYLLKGLNLAKLDKSTAVPGLSRDDYNAVEVAIAPLDQQQRVVAEIEKQFSRLDEAVANLKRVKANLKRYKAAVLKAAVEGKLTEEWRKEHPDVEPATTLLERIGARRDQWMEEQVKAGNSEAKKLRAKLKNHQFDPPNDIELPKSWVWASFLTLSQMVVDCHNKTAPYEASGIPLVRTTNIRDGKLNLHDVKHASTDTYTFWSRRCPPQPGDILFTREAPMGEAAVVPENVKLCMGQRIMLLRLFDDLIHAKYLLYSIMSPAFQSRLGGGAVGTGVRHLRVGDVEALPVPVPPAHEQTALIAAVESKLSVADEVGAQIERGQRRAERLRESILRRAYGGSLAIHRPDGGLHPN